MKAIFLIVALVASGCSDSLPAPTPYDSSVDTTVTPPVDGLQGDTALDGANPPIPDLGVKDSTVDKGTQLDSTIDKGTQFDSTIDQGKVAADATLDQPPPDTVSPDSTVDSTVDVGVCTAPPGGSWTADTQAMAVVGSSKVLYAVTGTDANNVYVAGYGGEIWRRTGSGWSHYTTFPIGNGFSVYDMYLDGNKLFAAGGNSNGGAVGIYDGTKWTVKNTYKGTANDIPKMKAISGVSSVDVYAAGGTLLLRYTGTDWQEYPSPGSTKMEAVVGMTGGVAFVGRGAEIYKFSGGAFGSSAMATPAIGDVRAMWRQGNNVVSVGLSIPGGQSIIYYDGANWMPDNAPGASLLSVHGSGGVDDIFAVGSLSTILHFNGSSWTEPWITTVPTQKIQLQDVWVDKYGTVGYAVGATSNVWKFTRCP